MYVPEKGEEHGESFYMTMEGTRSNMVYRCKFGEEYFVGGFEADGGEAAHAALMHRYVEEKRL
jgi:hypothetical protein